MNHETPIRKREAFLQLLGELGGGTFLDTLIASFEAAALSTAVNGDKGKKGKLALTFDMTRIGESLQLQLGHRIDLKAPTVSGKRTEETGSSTPVFVSRTGTCSILPTPDQGGLFNPEGTAPSSAHKAL